LLRHRLPDTICARTGTSSTPRLHPADRFISVLRYIGDGYMDRGVTWEQFKQQGGKK
jgi:hypothetical protein